MPASVSRPRVFGYVASIDPALATFGWKIIGLAHLAMLAPLLGAFLPRDAATNWPWLITMGAVAFTIGGVNLWHLRRMVRSDGYRSPDAFTVLVEVVITTIAAAGISYSLGGQTGIYQPIIFVPTLLMAMIGNRWVITVAWLVATVSVATVAVASNTLDQSVAAFVISYGTVWGIAAIMVHLLALASLQADQQVAGLVDVAGITARADSLTDGLEQVLPVMVDWAVADRAGAFRIRSSGVGSGNVGAPVPLYHWPESAIVQVPSADELGETAGHRGVAYRDHRAVLVAKEGDQHLIAIVLEGIAQPVYDQFLTRFNLERMVLQVDVLVNRSRYIARLADLGRTDGLTGLPNRRALDSRLEQARADSLRRGEPMTVVMIDLDEFKAFNDSFGHLAGDDLLRSYANELRNRLRTVDFVARYGGEEFLLVLSDTGMEGAETAMDQLHESFRALDDLHGLTFSAGIAEWDGREDDDTLIGRADRALYAAKAAGRDCTVVDHPDS